MKTVITNIGLKRIIEVGNNAFSTMIHSWQEVALNYEKVYTDVLKNKQHKQ